MGKAVKNCLLHKINKFIHDLVDGQQREAGLIKLEETLCLIKCWRIQGHVHFAAILWLYHHDKYRIKLI